ncbi:MAG: patatin-like phospholipase family protein [Rectinemataceae bacterium]
MHIRILNFCRAVMTGALMLALIGSPAFAAQPAPHPAAEATSASIQTGSFNAVFPQGDPLRVILEPVFLGEHSFRQRLSERTGDARQPLGLVLCGGSARAYAHVGVLKELEKRGIHPDFIVANSMGAIVGALYAFGLAPDDIAQLLETVPFESFLDVVLPTRGGFISTAKFGSVLTSLLGRTELSESAIPIIITGEDLTTRRQVWFAEGSIDAIIRGAFAMPAIFEPSRIGDSLIVDGGVAVIVPIEPALRFTDRVIISTALYDREMDFSNPLTVINRAIDIGKSRSGLQAMASSNALIIRNDVEHLSYMQFSDPRAIIARGAESAASLLSSLNATTLERFQTAPSAPSIEELQNIRLGMHQRLGRFIASIRAGAQPLPSAPLQMQPVLRLSPPQASSSLDQLELRPRAGLQAVLYRNMVQGNLGYSVMLPPRAGGNRDWAADLALEFFPFKSTSFMLGARLWGGYSSTALLGHQPQEWEALASLSAGFALPRRPLGLQLTGIYAAPLHTGSAKWKLQALATLAPPFMPQFRDDSSLMPSLAATSAAPPVQHAQDETPTASVWWAAQIGAFAEGSSVTTPSMGITGQYFLGMRMGLFSPRVRWYGSRSVNGESYAVSGFEGFRGINSLSSTVLLQMVNIDLALVPKGFSFDIGEALLVKNVEVWPFFDAIWAAPHSGDTPSLADWAGGLGLSCVFSAFGLAPAYAGMHAGYDANDGLYLALRAGGLFPAGE